MENNIENNGLNAIIQNLFANKPKDKQQNTEQTLSSYIDIPPHLKVNEKENNEKKEK